MRFRQAMSVLAQAMEAAATLHPDASSGLCALIGWFEDAVKSPHQHAYDKQGILRTHGTAEGYSQTYYWRGAVVALATMAGVQPWHVRRLAQHVHKELRKSIRRAYLTGVWIDTGEFGMKKEHEYGYSRELAMTARCAWLRTLGRTAPAKAVHAVE